MTRPAGKQWLCDLSTNCNSRIRKSMTINLQDLEIKTVHLIQVFAKAYQTMSLLTLPPELLAVIIGKLDTQSLYNMYAAGVAYIQGLVMECHFSANALATVKTLKSDFFTGVSGYLKILNMSGVSDLDQPCLLEALTNMKCLVDLDVSYTNINMCDFLEIAAARPTLKTIAINFNFIKSKKEDIMDEVLFRVKTTELPSYQQAFARFEDVHFVGRMHARVHGVLALLVLARAHLHNLTFTTTGAAEGSRLDFSAWNVAMVTAAQFQLYYLQIPRRRSILETHIFTVMDLKKYEVIIFCSQCKYSEINGREIQKVFATPALKRIVCEHFGVEIEGLSAPVSHAELSAKLTAARLGQGTHYACLFWDIDRTEFNSAFRLKLRKIFKEYFVFNVDAGASPVPVEFEWFSLVADTQNLLDYNTKFQKIEKVKLRIVFNKKLQLKSMPNTIKDRDFLGKITHLSLTGAVPEEPADFKGLFECCRSLETLQLALRRDIKFTFLQHLKEAKNLRNFSICYHCPDQTCILLTYLLECESLENIYLYNYPKTTLESVSNLFPLLSKFNKLYNFSLFVSLSNEEVNEVCRRVTFGRAALRFVLSGSFGYNDYHPYLSVFNLVFPLNPVSTHGCNVWKILSKK